MDMEDLENLRKKIDELDTQLIQLINERAKVSKQIGLVKNQTQTSVFQPDREKKVLDHIRSLASEISSSSAQRRV